MHLVGREGGREGGRERGREGGREGAREGGSEELLWRPVVQLQHCRQAV